MEATSSIPTETVAYEELRQAIERLIRGERDPEVMRRACERMDRMREELRARIGTVEMAVDLIREARDP
jgi:hypothetical protein